MSSNRRLPRLYICTRRNVSESSRLRAPASSDRTDAAWSGRRASMRRNKLVSASASRSFGRGGADSGSRREKRWARRERHIVIGFPGLHQEQRGTQGGRVPLGGDVARFEGVDLLLGQTLIAAAESPRELADRLDERAMISSGVKQDPVEVEKE